MPNWYHNTLFVMGNPQAVAAFKRKAAKPVPFEEPSPLNFGNFVPVPSNLLKFGGQARTGYDIENRRRPTNEEHDKQIGDDSRKDWEEEHWGCKWGACRAELEEEYPVLLIYYFDTAWCPPMRFMKQLARLYPDLMFRLHTECINDRAFHFIFMGDFFHVTDRTWILDAQLSCTCGAWAPKEKMRNAGNTGPAPGDVEPVTRDEQPSAQSADAHQGTGDPRLFNG